MADIIALEQDIKNLTDTTNSITENKAATKTRAESLGAIIIGNYSNNQLVCKKDACIIKSGDFSETYSGLDLFMAHYAVIVPKTQVEYVRKVETKVNNSNWIDATNRYTDGENYRNYYSELGGFTKLTKVHYYWRVYTNNKDTQCQRGQQLDQ